MKGRNYKPNLHPSHTRTPNYNTTCRQSTRFHWSAANGAHRLQLPAQRARESMASAHVRPCCRYAIGPRLNAVRPDALIRRTIDEFFRGRGCDGRADVESRPQDVGQPFSRSDQRDRTGRNMMARSQQTRVRSPRNSDRPIDAPDRSTLCRATLGSPYARKPVIPASAKTCSRIWRSYRTPETFAVRQHLAGLARSSPVGAHAARHDDEGRRWKTPLAAQCQTSPAFRP